MKHISIITDEYPPDPGGVGQSVARISRLIHGKGYQVTVIVLENREADPLVEEYKDDDIHVIRLRKTENGNDRRQEYDAERLVRLLQIYHRRPVDLFHSFFPTTTGMVTGILARTLGKPFLASFRGNDIYQGIFSRHLQTIRWILTHANHVTFMNQEMADIAQAVEPNVGNWEIVHNGVNPPLNHALELNRKTEKNCHYTIGTMGYFRPKKGIQTLIKAATQLKIKKTKFKLLLVGDFPMKMQQHWNDQLKDADLLKCTTVTHMVPHQQIYSYFPLMNVFVYPTVYDGCPNSLLEAASCGLPIICSRIAATTEILEEGKECLMHDTESYEQLTGCLEHLMRHPDIANRMGRAARQKVLSRFTLTKEEYTWRNIYHKLTSTGGF